MEEKSPEIRRICKACGASKLIKDFVKCKSCVGGYTPRCRHCVANERMIVREPVKKERLSDDFLAMSGIGKDTYIEMYLFFQKIGYDLSRPIAEQFAEKHNLKMKNRSKHKLNRYSPESLGLI